MGEKIVTKKAPTIQEVARQAGVSIGTASNVMHGKSELHSPKTAQKVWESARSLGYRSNHLARSLARQRTATLGVVTERHQPMMIRNLYFSYLLDGFLEHAVPHTYQIKLISVLNDDPQNGVLHIENGTVDGAVLIAPVIDSPLLSWAQQSRLPVVVIGSTLPESFGLTCVDVDNEQATRQAIEWLIQQGHRRIGFVKGDPLHWSAYQREQAYLRSMQEHGIVPPQDWLVQGDYMLDSGRKAMEQLLKCRPPLTAIFASNDQMALGIMDACRQYRIRVPAEVSVVGFDNVEHAALTIPTLTTVHHPVREIGMQAAELLIEQVETDKRFAKRVLLPGELVVRDSTRPLEAEAMSASTRVRSTNQ
jgi:LacI family transcriptional regulator